MKASHDPTQRKDDRVNRIDSEQVAADELSASRACRSIIVYAIFLLPFIVGGCGTLLKRAPEPTATIEERSYHPDIFLSDREYASVVVEIDYATGCRPEDIAIDGLRRTLELYCNKPGGIEIVVDEEICSVGKGEAVSDSTCYELMDEHADIEVPDGCLHLYVLYVPYLADRFSGKGSRGWCSYSRLLIVIARQKIHDYGFLHLTGAKFERLVLIHEAGHALGLVTNDEHEYRGHCTNPTCVMYYDLDWRAILANLFAAIFGVLPCDFCEECREDIELRRRERMEEGKGGHLRYW